MINDEFLDFFRSVFLGLLLLPFPAFAQNINYNQHIAPIIQKNCISCHAPGEIGPMPLNNFKEVSSYGQMINFVTKTRYMPPWKPVHPIGEIKDERRLTDEEISLIKKWAENGFAEGEGAAPVLKKEKISTLEKWDATVAMSEAFEQYGVYYEQFRVFILPTDFGEGKEISGIEFVPGDRTIVRNAMISIDTTDAVKSHDEWDPQYGYFSFGELGFEPSEGRWYNWQPGKGATVFPEGYGKFLPKGAKILLHIHYGPTGSPKKDSSFLKLKFAKTPLKKRLTTTAFLNQKNISNPTFEVLANDSVRVHARFTVPFDMEIHGVFPHCHLLGRRWEIFSVSPEGKSDVLLKIEDWDFKWKQMYDFKTPKNLKQGTVVHALAFYDNTENNLSNPSEPARKMILGKRMFEEMFLVYFEWAKGDS